MRVQVRFFASVREQVSTSSLNLDTDVGTVGGLRSFLAAQGPEWAAALGPDRLVRASRDQVMVDESAALRDGCEVAFFPPVTGG